MDLGDEDQDPMLVPDEMAAWPLTAMSGPLAGLAALASEYKVSCFSCLLQ